MPKPKMPTKKFVVANGVAGFMRVMPHDIKDSTLFYPIAYSGPPSNGLVRSAFRNPVVCNDGKVRIPSRLKVWTVSPGQYICIMDDSTGYGMTCGYVCAHRFVENLIEKHTNVSSLTSRTYPRCFRCPIPAKWYLSDNDEKIIPVEEED